MGDDPLAEPGYPLEPSADEIRRQVSLVCERLVEHLDSLPAQAVSDVEGGAELARGLIEGVPEAGAPLDELLDLLFDRALSKSYNTASPGYLAYIPGGGIFDAALGAFVAATVNRYATVWQAAPGLVQLETNVIRWFCELVGYPAEAGGYLATGGSMANLSALVTARRTRLPEDFLAGTLYASEQVHHSMLKAALMAGFPARNLRAVPVDSRYRIRVDRLEELIAEDRAAGLAPFLIVGSVGTTNTGAIDDLEALADVAGSERLWLHLDAAYGGFFALTDRGRERMPGIERADSITLDPHKGLFLPYGTGCLLVRDVAALRDAHAVTADYMPALQSSADRVDYCEISPELSREFRGLRVWLPFKLRGVGAFREALDEKLDLTEWAWRELETIDDLEIVAEPQLSLVVFRLRPEGVADDELDRLNQEFLAGINARQNVFLTGTLLEGRFVLRICVLSFRTHRPRMEQALADIRGVAAELQARRSRDRASASSRAGC